MRETIKCTLAIALLFILVAPAQGAPQEAGSVSFVEQRSMAPAGLGNLSISEVRITNVRDGSLTISWITNSPATGYVNFGLTTALGSTAYDDRGDTTVDDTHHVTLSGLSPETTYYFDVASDSTVDDNGGVHYTVSTGPTLGLPVPDTIYGQVFLADGVTPAEGAIVYITLMDSNGAGSPGQAAPMSTLVDEYGYWTVNLGNSRVAGLTNYFLYSSSGDSVAIEVQGAAQGTASQTVDTSADTPAASMTLVGCVLPGDLDGDHDVDIDDVMLVASRWRCRLGDGCYNEDYDLDEDDDIDIVDIMLVVKHWGESCG
jgi:hypothetical protein